MDIREINRRVIEQFRSGGEIDGMHRDRLVLLTTTGAKSGMRHTTPVMFGRDGATVLVVASNNGAPKAPDWFHNLVHQPHVGVEIGEDSYQAEATVLTGAERARQWAALTAAYPFLVEHERRAGREIPVIALTRL